MSSQASSSETGSKYDINLAARTGAGTGAARRARREGLLPTVVYERGKPAISASMDYLAFEKQAVSTRISQLFTLKFEGVPELNNRHAIIKEVQRNNLTGKMLHVDFQALRDDEEVVVSVPLAMIGEAYGVKTDGGVLSVAAYEISISSLPKSIPSILNVDVSQLKIGDSIHGKDLILPAGAKLAGNPEEAIVSVVISRQTVEETATPTAVAAAAGADGAAVAAGTAAPAAKADDKKADAGKAKK